MGSVSPRYRMKPALPCKREKTLPDPLRATYTGLEGRWKLMVIPIHSFAGSDTTAIAIRSIFYHLMQRPECMQKLVAEIDEFTAQGLLSEPHIRYNEAIKMPYLVACCKEGMRLHPSVGLGMPRHVPAGGVTISGRYFPAGSRVSINAAVFHYDESIFGPDAAEFNPDRWIKGDASLMDRHMLHFGGGSRTCIGKNVSCPPWAIPKHPSDESDRKLTFSFTVQISLAEMHKLIPAFLRRFKVELADPKRSWKTQNYWFNKQTGICVHVKTR